VHARHADKALSNLSVYLKSTTDRRRLLPASVSPPLSRQAINSSWYICSATDRDRRHSSTRQRTTRV